MHILIPITVALSGVVLMLAIHAFFKFSDRAVTFFTVATEFLLREMESRKEAEKQREELIKAITKEANPVEFFDSPQDPRN